MGFQKTVFSVNFLSKLGVTAEKLLIGDSDAPGLATILTNPQFGAKIGPSVPENTLVFRALVQFIASVCTQALCPTNYLNCRSVLFSEISLLLAIVSKADTSLTSNMASIFEILRLWLLANPSVTTLNSSASSVVFNLNNNCTDLMEEVITPPTDSPNTSNRTINKLRACLGAARARRFASWLSVQYPSDYRNGLAACLGGGNPAQAGASPDIAADFSLGGRDILEKTPQKSPLMLWGTESRSGFPGDQFLAVLRTPGPWDKDARQDSSDRTPQDWSFESSFMLPIQEPDVTRVSGGNLLKVRGDMEETTQVIEFGPETQKEISQSLSILRPFNSTNYGLQPKRGARLESPLQNLPKSGLKSLVTPARPTNGDSTSADTMSIAKLAQKSAFGRRISKGAAFTPNRSGPDKENTNIWNTGPKLAGRAPFQPT